MAKIDIYTIDGSKSGSMTVSDSVFDAPKNDALLHQVANALRSNQHQSTAHTKDRSERRGSGRKPWRQKGTGNARTGSVRNPIWRKGGVIFGPRSQKNIRKNINKKMKDKAFAIAISEKLRNGNVFVVDSLDLPEKKTKQVQTLIHAIGIEGNVVAAFNTNERDSVRAARNIPTVKNRDALCLSTLDLLSAKNLLISKDTVDLIDRRYKRDETTNQEEPTPTKTDKKKLTATPKKGTKKATKKATAKKATAKKSTAKKTTT